MLNNRDTAKQALDLYHAIKLLDEKILHVLHRHKLSVDVWATVPTGNYTITVEVPKDSDFAPAIAAATKAQLLSERKVLEGKLSNLDFEVPELPTPADGFRTFDDASTNACLNRPGHV